MADLEDQPVDSLIRLYNADTAISTLGDDGAVVYHQNLQRVAVFMDGDAYEQGFPYEEHPEIWIPLETVLSHWIDLIHIGKVVASSQKEPCFSMDSKHLVVMITAPSDWSVCWIIGGRWLKMGFGLLGLKE